MTEEKKPEEKHYASFAERLLYLYADRALRDGKSGPILTGRGLLWTKCRIY
jgi:hypothetical protein